MHHRLRELLVKVNKPSGSPAVCMICWNKKTPLISCILSTTGFNPSNLKSHIKNCHVASEAPGCFSDVSTITASIASSSGKKLVGNKISNQRSILNYQQNPSDVPTPSMALSHLYQFFNDANVAIAQSNNVHLTHFIDYLIENGHQLKSKKTECYFSKYKYSKQRDDRFVKFISSLKELVLYSRDYYKVKFKKEVPFLCVSHDGWDSIEHDILGVCVHFIVPGYWKIINLAIGLKRIRSKKSIETSKAIFIILQR